MNGRCDSVTIHSGSGRKWKYDAVANPPKIATATTVKPSQCHDFLLKVRGCEGRTGEIAGGAMEAAGASTFAGKGCSCRNRYPTRGIVSTSNALLPPRSDSWRTLETQRLMASSPTMRPPQHCR